MPPLPNTYDEEVTSLIASIRRRQNDLLEFQIPRLRDCKGPLSVQQNFAAEVREDVDALARQIEVGRFLMSSEVDLYCECLFLFQILDVSVADQKGEKNRRELRRVVDDHAETLARYVSIIHIYTVHGMLM